MPPPGQAQRRDPSLRALRGLGEDLEVDPGDELRELGQHERDAQIRLVRAVVAQGVGVAHSREGIGELDAEGVGEQPAHHPLRRAHDGLLVDEAHLDVELGELGLTVGAQVLVAKAAGDLVVAIHAAHHQELLEQLRGLRQREEVPGVGTARHEVVARALGGRPRQHRRVDLDEALRVEAAAERADDPGAKAHAFLHLRAAEIDVAVAQPHLLGDVVVVELERRGRGAVEDLELVPEDLDLPGRHLGIDRALGSDPNPTGDAQHELVPDLLGAGEGIGAVGIEDRLHHAGVVAKIDEDHPAVIAPAMRPAAEGDFLADLGGGEDPAGVCAHRWSPVGGEPAIVDRTPRARCGPGAAAAEALPAAASGPVRRPCAAAARATAAPRARGVRR